MVDGDAIRIQPVRHLVQILAADIVGVKSRTIEQRAEDTHHRGIKAIGGEQDHPILGAEVETVGVVGNVAEDVAVNLGNTFGSAGGTGGVEQVGRRIGRDHRQLFTAVALVIETIKDNGCRTSLRKFRSARGVLGVREDHLSLSIGENIGLPILGVTGIERDVGLAGLQHSEDCGDHRRVVFEKQCDLSTRRSTTVLFGGTGRNGVQPQKFLGDPVGALI